MRFIAFALLLAACSKESPPSAPLVADPPQGPPRPEPTTPGPATSPQSIVGWWTSNGCGARQYRRTLELRADGTFQADDIVHPCPGECVVQWVARREGTWALQGNDLKVVVSKVDDPQNQAKDGQPLPGSLLADQTGVAERAGSGPLCRYVR